jgi:hypothetical protein
MIEISKERAAKRKREREARQRGCFAESPGFGSLSGSGGSMGDDSNISSAESSLDTDTSSSYRFNGTSDSIPKFSPTGPIARGNIPSQGIKPATTLNIRPPHVQIQVQGSIKQPVLGTIQGPPRDIIPPNLDPPQAVGSAHTPAHISKLTEEVKDDDDADLKRLMNQAENMLKIADTPAMVGSEPPSSFQSQSESEIQVDGHGTPSGNVGRSLGREETDVIDVRR